MMFESWYDFSKHFPSTQWIHQLPKGLVFERVNLTYRTVTVEKDEGVSTVYIGPKRPESGGDAILIRLDHALNVLDYEIERLAPLPKRFKSEP